MNIPNIEFIFILLQYDRGDSDVYMMKQHDPKHSYIDIYRGALQ